MATKRMKRGSKIDFTQVKCMVFETYHFGRSGDEVEIALKHGTLELHRGIQMEPSSAIAITPALADKLTQLFATCGVSSWKCNYEPKGYIVCDGEGWNLKLVFEDESVFRAKGSNAWPDEFDALKEGLLGLFDSFSTC